MKVAIDTEFMPSYPNAGIAVYMRHLFAAMTKMKEGIELSSVCLSSRPALRKKMRQVLDGIDISMQYYPIPGRFQKSTFVKNFLRKRLPIPNLYHAPANFYPEWMNSQKAPCVATIHDIVTLRYEKDKFSPYEYEYNYSELLKAVQKSTAIISVSEFTKRELCSLMEIPEEKIFVTPISSQFTQETISGPDSDILKNNGLDGEDFFLSVGTLSPRKNYNTLLKAFDQFSDRNNSAKLVIAGNPGWECRPIVEEIQKRNSKVLWLRNISTLDLATLYRNAMAFFLVSYYEGFGIPILEAMQCGCPVCYAGGSSMDEVGGDAGIKVQPGDADEIANAMNRLHHDKELRHILSRSGLARATQFTWENCARKTMNVYKTVAGECAPAVSENIQ